MNRREVVVETTRLRAVTVLEELCILASAALLLLSLIVGIRALLRSARWWRSGQRLTIKRILAATALIAIALAVLRADPVLFFGLVLIAINFTVIIALAMGIGSVIEWLVPSLRPRLRSELLRSRERLDPEEQDRPSGDGI